ncbi:restriction endonuclease [Mesorhizobium sp. AD1-1]|uniref:restriction endonuclease n=1 Tax=Mesorhizobium sp. AD1-1 TaxID=2876621 RepID=UPI001CCAEB0C|nr:restriction endonuclease [Mesorhizobium sp. AD1-1]MBZ9716846.1 restriction endonuclease [Mesorhizobium sp. AD1-1]
MKVVPVDQLSSSDLHVDAIYQGGRKGNAGDDPLPTLMRVDSQGGFRYRGKVKGKLEMLVLMTSMNDADWPDDLDAETGIFTYYGDNKKPGRDLHDTGRDGNLILKTIFEDSRSGAEGRGVVPPIFLFSGVGVSRDVRFLGLAVPGASDLDASEELVAIWRNVKGSRFQNYRARFTVLDAAQMSRAWIDSIVAKQPNHGLAPDAWKTWRKTGKRKALIAGHTMEYRSRAEQLPDDKDGQALIGAVREHFKDRPHAFEHCAAALARLMIPDIAGLDVTRPSRDGGRDAVGQLRVGTGQSGILMDFALEAKCYSPPTAVGVKDMSRLISRLRHRQFGVLVTTSCVDLQAYKEIKEDQHPILILSAKDIVELLRRNGRGSLPAVKAWLEEEFPKKPNWLQRPAR